MEFDTLDQAQWGEHGTQKAYFVNNLDHVNTVEYKKQAFCSEIKQVDEVDCMYTYYIVLSQGEFM